MRSFNRLVWEFYKENKRDFPLEGTNIDHDRQKVNHGFQLNKEVSFDAHIDTDALSVKSGVYHTFEFVLSNKPS